MKTKCDKCMHKCKSECCTFVPFDEQFLLDHQDKFQRPVYAVATDDSKGQKFPYVFPITHIEEVEKEIDGKLQKVNYIDKMKQVCPFLTNKKRCAIYAERPTICRAFGTELIPDHPLTCGYHIGRNKHSEDLPHEQRMMNFIKYMPEISKKFPTLIKEMGGVI